MKKLLKFSAQVLIPALALVIFGCSNPTNIEPPVNNRKTVTSLSDAVILLDELQPEFVYLAAPFKELMQNEDFSNDVVSKTVSINGDNITPQFPINLDLKNKNYKTTGLKLNIEKGQAQVDFEPKNIFNKKDYKNGNYTGFADIAGNVILNGTKIENVNKIKKIDGNVIFKAGTNESPLQLNLLTLPIVGTIPESFNGELSDFSINTVAKFDTGDNGYAGNAKLKGKITIKNINDLLDIVKNKDEGKPLLDYTTYYLNYKKWEKAQSEESDSELKNTPEPKKVSYPTEENLSALYDSLNKLNMTFNLEFYFTDLNGETTLTVAIFNKLSDFIKVALPPKLEKNQ